MEISVSLILRRVWDQIWIKGYNLKYLFAIFVQRSVLIHYVVCVKLQQKSDLSTNAK